MVSQESKGSPKAGWQEGNLVFRLDHWHLKGWLLGECFANSKTGGTINQPWEKSIPSLQTSDVRTAETRKQG